MFVIFSLLFVAMGVRLVTLQIVDGARYEQLAARQRERVIPFPARRGAIFDRNGESLAVSLDHEMVFADPAHVEDVERLAGSLAPLIDVPVKELIPKLVGAVPGDRFEYIARQVAPDVAKKIKALDLPGIYFEDEPKRYYPGGRLAAHLLGFVNVDGTPFGGVEGAYDGILKGKAGEMTLEQDPVGLVDALPQAQFQQTRARPGRSLFLTIDKDVQYFTEHTLSGAVDEFGADGGSAIVMKVGTGEILAMANAPTYDPNRAGEFDPAAQRNRAVTDVYEPGSAFKIVTASAALEEGIVTPKTRYQVPDNLQVSDRVINDSHPHATENMTVSEIIEQSSNVGTVKMGLELGGARLDHYMKLFGFGSRTGLGFPGESAGIMLPRDEWSGSTIATLPIGQGVAVTPLQMAAAYSTIANDGVWVEPKLLYSTMDGSGAMTTASPPSTKRIISQKTALQMRKILTRVVKQGTGLEGAVPAYQVAGKTGTAQQPLPGGGYGNSYVGSFGGFAPASRPELVVFVMLDEPRPIWGGATAAPTFRAIMEFTLRHLGVSPTGNAEKAADAIEDAAARSGPTHD
ncbi:MAG: penicillin-binding protein 2 [Actinomycetota bacterium]|nr:penicillin-binding protein 2 [Actinomycetota bacterium]